MKYFMTIALSVLIFGAAIPPTTADDRTTTKGPTKTMGDEGKLPATGTVSETLPEMRGEGAPASPRDALSEDGTKRMGDEGRLPATGAMSGAVPKMNTPSGTND